MEGVEAPRVLAPAAVGARRGPLGWVLTSPRLQGWAGAWLAFGIWVAIVTWGHAVLWLSGRLAAGQVDWELVVLSVYAPFGLLATMVGRRIARRALDRFWPATGWPDDERPRWAARFDMAPAAHDWLATAAGALLGLVTLVTAPASLLGPEPGRTWIYLAYVPAFIAGYGVLVTATLLSFRWLRLVSRIHREAQAIDPLERGPIYAFSRLTGWGGLMYVVGSTYTLTFNATFQAENVIALAIVLVSNVVGFLTFILPLWGIHGRLQRDKEDLLREHDARASRLAAEVYARVDGGAYESTKVLNEALGALGTVRQRIEHLPTWPWPPQLLRGFVSALLLPLLIYVLTRVISSVV